jgi:hypothetical protein
MKPPRRGAKALATFMPQIIEEALAARGLSEASLVADWPAIVGDSIARYARPIQLQWPPRAAKRDPDAPVAPSTLVLRVDGAFALEAQHNAAIIVARVNAHLGWRCVEKVAFRQGPLPPPKEKRRLPVAPSAEAEAEARGASSSVEDEDLRAALTRLGARAIDQSARRLAATRAVKGD